MKKILCKCEKCFAPYWEEDIHECKIYEYQKPLLEDIPLQDRKQIICGRTYRLTFCLDCSVELWGKTGKRQWCDSCQRIRCSNNAKYKRMVINNQKKLLTLKKKK